MRDVLESVCSLIQVSDHDTGTDNGDTYDNPITAVALDAYRRLMPFRTFDDASLNSRFLTRSLGTNVLLISPDFRSLDRSPGAWPDDESKTAYGDYQFSLLVAAPRGPRHSRSCCPTPGATHPIRRSNLAPFKLLISGAIIRRPFRPWRCRTR